MLGEAVLLVYICNLILIMWLNCIQAGFMANDYIASYGDSCLLVFRLFEKTWEHKVKIVFL
jgi:hypothetical protein